MDPDGVGDGVGKFFHNIPSVWNEARGFRFIVRLYTQIPLHTTVASLLPEIWFVPDITKESAALRQTLHSRYFVTSLRLMSTSGISSWLMMRSISSSFSQSSGENRSEIRSITLAI